MKKFRFLQLGIVALSMLATTTVFADTTANVLIDGSTQQVQYTDQQPLIINSRTYVPIRDVFETMNFKVEWDNESKTVGLINDYYYILLFTKTNSMAVIDNEFGISYYPKLQNEVQLVNGRTLLPLREILESVGYSLTWDSETKSAIVFDRNDYTAFKANKAEINAIADKKFEYNKYNNLAENENAFVKNVYDTVEKLDNIAKSYTASRVTAKSSAQLMKDISKDFFAVECPEKYSGLDEKLADIYIERANNLVVIDEILQLNGNNKELANLLYATDKARTVSRIKAVMQEIENK